MPENKRCVTLLSQFGFSENVFDKDGQTPLDFQERIKSDEVQQLIDIHRKKTFNITEPNPWTWQVWTKIQQERDSLKQLIAFSNPFDHSSRGHDHNHSHSHSHSHGHSHNQNQLENSNCKIM
jgi:hypothetical protein